MQSFSNEITDTGYGFTDSKGIEVCSDRELEELYYDEYGENTDGQRQTVAG